jgi:sirohydrochlorin ferrochelatase
LARRRRLTGRAIVEPAHMELAEPTIEQAVAACAARGAKRIVVAPYFLSRGRHIQEDIPALVAAAQRAHPEVRCVVAAPLGGDPLMAQLLDARVAQAAAAASTGHAGGGEAG